MIPIVKPLIGDEEIEAVVRVLRSGMIAQGEEVYAFEREFASYVGVKHGVAVSSGTAALDIALKALGIGEGDEVITTPFTFIASANAILFQRAKPVFADIDSRTFNLDPGDANEKITSKTRAILVVHLYGQPADMKAFTEIAEDHNLLLVEDCAQAHGATFNGRMVGSFGHVAVFSFYTTKNIITGEGGMVVTNSDEVAWKARLLRDHGQAEKYHHVELGYNLRMMNIQAAIGRVQLKKLNLWNEIRSRNASLLTSGISRVKGLTPPYVDGRVKHVWHQYVVRVEDDFKLRRDELTEYLRVKGIETSIHYPIPIHWQPLYQRLGYPRDICPNAVDACRRVLSLPVHPALTRQQIEYIVNVLEDVRAL